MPKTKKQIFNRRLRVILSLLLVISVAACASGGSKRPGNTRGSTAPVTDKALIHAQLARGYLQQKQYSVAKSELEKAFSINPNHSDSNYVMGLLMLELEQYEDTEKYFRQSVRNDRNNSAAAHDLGVFLCQIGKEDESVTFFELAVSNPFFSRAELSYMRAGECLARVGDSRAEKFLKDALELNPRLQPALYRLAVLKYDSGSYFSARAYIERFFAINKPQPASLLLAYKIELKLNAVQVAEKYRLQLLEQFPGSNEANSIRRQNRS